MFVDSESLTHTARHTAQPAMQPARHAAHMVSQAHRIGESVMASMQHGARILRNGPLKKSMRRAPLTYEASRLGAPSR